MPPASWTTIAELEKKIEALETAAADQGKVPPRRNKAKLPWIKAELHKVTL